MEPARKLEREPGSRALKPQQIREAAARLFIEQGYGAVSMDAIAREAGVSKATIYAHFPDKAELFGALMYGECLRLWPDIALLDAEPADLRATLLALGRAYASALSQPRAVAVYRMVVAETPRFPELGRAFFENGPKMVTDRLASYLARAAAQGRLALSDPRFAAQQFLALLRCEYHLRSVLQLDPPIEAGEVEAVAAGATAVFLGAYGRGSEPDACFDWPLRDRSA
jgi:TetR/AcrR family transcriptional regulator, mexJK operon transcriptional repressor